MELRKGVMVGQGVGSRRVRVDPPANSLCCSRGIAAQAVTGSNASNLVMCDIVYGKFALDDNGQRVESFHN